LQARAIIRVYHGIKVTKVKGATGSSPIQRLWEIAKGAIVTGVGLIIYNHAPGAVVAIVILGNGTCGFAIFSTTKVAKNTRSCSDLCILVMRRTSRACRTISTPRRTILPNTAGMAV